MEIESDIANVVSVADQTARAGDILNPPQIIDGLMVVRFEETGTCLLIMGRRFFLRSAGGIHNGADHLFGALI